MTPPPDVPPRPSFLRRFLARPLRILIAWSYAGAVICALPVLLFAVKAKRWNTDRQLRRLLRSWQADPPAEGAASPSLRAPEVL